MPSLASCYLRIDRAEKRLDEVRTQIARYVEANEAIEVKVDGHTVSLTTWLPMPPPEIAITAGEVVYNLRAALDYLVFELAMLDCFGLDEGEINMRTQFPVESVPDGFQARRKRDRRGRPGSLTGLNDAHCDAIEAVQPYDGPNWAEFLRDLSNEDKHRAVPLLAYAGEAQTINVGGTDEEAEAFGGYRKPGDPATYYPASISVQLGGAPGIALTKTLEILKSEVRAVIDSFEPEFQGATQDAPSPQGE